MGIRPPGRDVHGRGVPIHVADGLPALPPRRSDRPASRVDGGNAERRRRWRWRQVLRQRGVEHHPLPREGTAEPRPRSVPRRTQRESPARTSDQPPARERRGAGVPPGHRLLPGLRRRDLDPRRQRGPDHEPVVGEEAVRPPSPRVGSRRASVRVRPVPEPGVFVRRASRRPGGRRRPHRPPHGGAGPQSGLGGRGVPFEGHRRGDTVGHGRGGDDAVSVGIRRGAEGRGGGGHGGHTGAARGVRDEGLCSGDIRSELGDEFG
mmetsp:Transcript_7693/g.22609  ORF Transcript_7693/g.22609 Transcript_7693/m.22609 type:complete len:263 (+) Transcript_7693:1040-1828(+)